MRDAISFARARRPTQTSGSSGRFVFPKWMLPAALTVREGKAGNILFESMTTVQKKPAFIYRHLVGSEQLEFARLSDRITEAENPDAIIAGVFDTAAKGLVGWENMIDSATGREIAFDPAES